jgi:hypothetical protein
MKKGHVRTVSKTHTCGNNAVIKEVEEILAKNLQDLYRYTIRGRKIQGTPVPKANTPSTPQQKSVGAQQFFEENRNMGNLKTKDKLITLCTRLTPPTSQNKWYDINSSTVLQVRFCMWSCVQSHTHKTVTVESQTTLI